MSRIRPLNDEQKLPLGFPHPYGCTLRNTEPFFNENNPKLANLQGEDSNWIVYFHDFERIKTQDNENLEFASYDYLNNPTNKEFLQSRSEKYKIGVCRYGIAYKNIQQILRGGIPLPLYWLETQGDYCFLSPCRDVDVDYMLNEYMPERDSWMKASHDWVGRVYSKDRGNQIL
ncbi:hypothetical protein BGW36DRAFT_361897 [Talaromyces proteolyticus]|uniref:Uncharacterized protein n=1 Tax=Talaromyces proteolyticus TaxID=1131652 RepID=A0AAD4PU00_9EURO|nr:uncharacterized protein BGW36DRAFT_361897 [Talaromyces proteolyticus]KAH8694073.1 hypothetical protein BGW36DRAFT_361897 [Talaromyces proteolyticus]